MRGSSALVLLVAAGGGVAAELDSRAAYPPAICSIINKVVVKAKAQKVVSTYCSSFLRLPAYGTTTVTSTSTITEVATTVETGATTINGGVTTVTVKEPSASLSIPPACISGSPSLKGRAAAIPKPACLAGYNKPAAISSACSCLCTKGKALSTTTRVRSTTVTSTLTNSDIQTSTTFSSTSTVTETTATPITNFYIRASGGPYNDRYPNPRPTNGEVYFDSDTPETTYRFRDDCLFEVVGGEFAGRVSTYRGNQAASVYMSDGNPPLFCQVVLGDPRPQLVCPINGNGTNSASQFSRGEWDVGVVSDRSGNEAFAALLIPVTA
ncbi:hypothetical protein CKM354_000160000 [Cercospora kikuchii]|uniref:Uncharacterized protein n=1 Tax=Cercospora kikuchii TaxID=84275 RepID=A0A9P3FC16_9PEZI|nr:uncharacterized protein CKM354_000160000 [Cercospora kikuchii]GIZ38177.1 hypothetical protein CKM354_000160000 [Cercospora kikuchii]